jgi:hypothetical protein
MSVLLFRHVVTKKKKRKKKGGGKKKRKKPLMFLGDRQAREQWVVSTQHTYIHILSLFIVVVYNGDFVGSDKFLRLLS